MTDSPGAQTAFPVPPAVRQLVRVVRLDAETAKTSTRTVDSALSHLLDDGEIQRGKDGRQVIFRLPDEEPK